MWPVGIVTEATFFVFFVVRVVASEPGNYAVPLKRQDVRTNPIQEPAIV
jgi:hypothetical protein